MSSRLKRLFIVFAVAAVVIAALWWWSLGKETTDDAFVQRDVVYLKPRVDGPLVDVAVHDNQPVKAGQVLATIDPEPYQASLSAAQAKVANAQASLESARASLTAFQANLAARKAEATASVEVAKAQITQQERTRDAQAAKIEQARRDVKRYSVLVERSQVSKQTLENARTNLNTLESDHAATAAAVSVARSQLASARAQQQAVAADDQRLPVMQAAVDEARANLEQAQASLTQAQLNLDWTTIKAPVDGWISELQARTGAMVGPQATLVILVSGHPWIKANYKETQIGDMHVGDRVDIDVDAYPNKTLTGHVASFQPGTGSRFALLPPENATGNFVKVVQRVPIRIELDDTPEDMQLWPGMSVVPTVHLDSAGKQP
ncbi:HlyD family secretion protein [Marinobacter sp. NFXS9]|uniref:HlyD family secretion protein n=1 Tax=Marinobacter sp. NFXS9 TaxID=2818433 RepID=UPI0032DF1917